MASAPDWIAGRLRAPPDIDRAMKSRDAGRPCPLCGRGELTGQHLLVWCPVVCDLTRQLCGGLPRAAVADRQDGAPGPRRELAELLHQCVFIALTTHGRTVMTPHVLRHIGAAVQR